MTIREIMKELNFVFNSNIAQESMLFCMDLVLKDKRPFNFAVNNDNDKRHEVHIVFGEGYTTFKNGHIHKVYCVLPREYNTPALQQYRDLRDPHMYKYLLPEREFNSFLVSFPINIPATVEVNKKYFEEV